LEVYFMRCLNNTKNHEILNPITRTSVGRTIRPEDFRGRFQLVVDHLADYHSIRSAFCFRNDLDVVFTYRVNL
jgi:hypothetical protein